MKKELDDLLQEQNPKLRSKVDEILEKSGQGIEAYGPEKLFGQVYDLLPFAVRVVIKKDKFVSFCIANQNQFLA